MGEVMMAAGLGLQAVSMMTNSAAQKKQQQEIADANADAKGRQEAQKIELERTKAAELAKRKELIDEQREIMGPGLMLPGVGRTTARSSAPAISTNILG
jgi:hypothetical protein